MPTSINVKIGGKAGEGIKTTGLTLSKCFSRLGFAVFGYDEYPSLIRGGHNSYQMYASHEPVHAQHRLVNILIALNQETVQLHQAELTADSLVLYDPAKFPLEKLTAGKPLAIPCAQVAKEAGGSEIMANMVSLGAVLRLSHLPLTPLLEIITEVFGGKGREVVEANHKATQAGADYIDKNYPQDGFTLEPPEAKPQIVVLGNEAIGAGAIASGLKYFAAYPMTPTSTILHFLAEQAEKHNLVVNHVENEIAAINTAIGASSMGVRSMVSTSGGGFSLMVEGLGMTGIAEVPLVVVVGTRPGPATGMPTWGGQGDLRFAIHASQDELPRIVLTPGDAFEAFELTQKAFLLAEKYQLPVILLVDKLLCESHKSGVPFPKVATNDRYGFADNILAGYQRYALTQDGVSPRPWVGQSGGASVVSNSYEHGPDSLVTEEAQDRKAMHEKRLRKLVSAQQDLWQLPHYGNPEAKKIVVGFGSTLGSVREALKELPDWNYLHFNYVWPFPKDEVATVLNQAETVACVEANALGQLQGLIREQTGIQVLNSFHKYDGRPFYPEEIKEYLTKL
jgi:2-oxoglutarate ferredoxin oxidoreductase subunit alpha